MPAATEIVEIDFDGIEQQRRVWPSSSTEQRSVLTPCPVSYFQAI